MIAVIMRRPRVVIMRHLRADIMRRPHGRPHGMIIVPAGIAALIRTLAIIVPIQAGCVSADNTRYQAKLA